MDEVIAKIVSSHLLYSPYIKSKIQNLDVQPVLDNYDYRGSNYKFVIWSHLAALLAPLVKPLFIFSSAIPSFFELNWDDRLMCLKLRFFEIWVVHASCLANCDDGTMTFSNGCYMSRHQLEVIYDESFVSQLFNFADCLKDLQLSDSAVALYSAVVLYSTDVLERMQPAILKQIQEKYKIYLSYQLFVLDHKPEAFEILLALLPELQDIGRRHLQFTKTISTEILPHAKEPVLLADVFNLTKEKDIKKLTKV